jgi:hypothetical protein
LLAASPARLKGWYDARSVVIRKHAEVLLVALYQDRAAAEAVKKGAKLIAHGGFWAGQPKRLLLCLHRQVIFDAEQWERMIMRRWEGERQGIVTTRLRRRRLRRIASG